MNHELNFDPDKLVIDDLNSELVEAISFGYTEAIDEALEDQMENDTTIAVSNHLKARSFMVRQKGYFVMLEAMLVDDVLQDDVTSLTQGIVDTLRNDYEATFLADQGNDKLHKLSSDEAFRDFIRIGEGDVDAEDLDNEDFVSSITKAKWHLIEMNTMDLASPEEMYEWMEYLSNDIATPIERILVDISEYGATEQNIFRLRREVMKQIDLLNSSLLEMSPLVRELAD